jgi:hypothetical protein
MRKKDPATTAGRRRQAADDRKDPVPVREDPVPIGPRIRKGRPTKDPVPGQKMSLGLKVTAEVKWRLDRAARKSGRTQSQEAEMRIERSFDREALLSEVLSLAYGRETAGLLIMLGETMKAVVDRTSRAYGHWLVDGSAYFEVEQAVIRLLNAARPSEVSQQPTPQNVGLYGPNVAEEMIRTLRGDASIMSEDYNPFGAHVDTIKTLIGPMAQRMVDTLEGKRPRAYKLRLRRGTKRPTEEVR